MRRPAAHLHLHHPSIRQCQACKCTRTSACMRSTAHADPWAHAAEDSPPAPRRCLAQAYEARPGHFWYCRQYTPQRLRIEEAPPPLGAAPAPAVLVDLSAEPVAAAASSAAAAAQRAAGGAAAAEAGYAGGGEEEPPTMVDLFCGLGTVSLAAQDAGFKVGGWAGGRAG